MSKNYTIRVYVLIAVLYVLTVYFVSHLDRSRIQVNGIVFVDDNLNGVLDSTERTIAAVGVTDGRSIVMTDNGGRYSFDFSPHDKPRFIYTILPPGYKNVDKFYSKLPRNVNLLQTNFPLIRDTSSKKDDFTIALITDIHIKGDNRALIEDLACIAELGPDFIVSDGDLVDNGEKTSDFDLYKQACSSIDIPIYNVMGNHDKPLINYEDNLGPSYYSLNYGKYHIVVFNSIDSYAVRTEWLRNDLFRFARTKDVIVFSHYTPSRELLSLFSGYRLRAWFSGHRHANIYAERNGMHDFITGSLSFGNYDLTPRGFELINVNGTTIDVANRYYGRSGSLRYLAIVTPQDGCAIGPGKNTLQASVYDTCSRKINVEYSLDGTPWKSMDISPGWNRTGEVELTPGRHSLKVRANFDDGSELEKESTFTVASEKPASPVTGRDWPMFKNGPDRLASSSEKTRPPLRLSWTSPLGGFANVSSPVTAEGLVFIGLADNEGKGRRGIYAIDAASGEIKWRHKTGASVKNAVSYYKGIVYACDLDGTLYALDAESGTLVWKTHVSDEYKKWFYCSPVVGGGGSVYLGRLQKFVSIDASTGEFKWIADTLGENSSASVSSPALGDTDVFIGFNKGGDLYALDRETGKLLWKRESDWFIGTPACVKDVIYITSDLSVFAVDARTGRDIWEYKTPSFVLSSPSVSGSKVYIGTGGDRMVALDASSGREMWSFQTGSSRMCFIPYGRTGGAVVSTPSISDGTLYFGGADGVFYALDEKTGRKLWSCDLGAPITSSPAISGNSVFITAIDGTVYGFTGSK